GEPTAFCRDGDLHMDYPPTPEIFLETMKEVIRLTRKGIKINTFMLDEQPFLVEFVDQMTRINRGRAFFSTSQRLGEYLLVDYLARRRRLIN
ncbi:MAG: VWA domain-containing protein, partial [Candidatus Hydrogenedentota bacterium]